MKMRTFFVVKINADAKVTVLVNDKFPIGRHFLKKPWKIIEFQTRQSIK